MKRFSMVVATLAGLGLLMTACMPIDEINDAPEPSSSSGGSHDAHPLPIQVPETPVPLQPYSADGLDQRISQLPPSMAAHQIQQGLHPLDDGEPGSEHVVLAERFSSSMDFELPRNLTSDHISVELTCSRSVSHSFSIIDGNGRETGGSSMGSCGSEGPSGMRTGLRDTQEAGQIQVRFEGESDMVLSVVAYTGTHED
ncbi:hypothetical protein [Paeniglutamicibacter psychrophenolicus]|uniref:Uncharacterized protein n=1 Tax=Paeniglutamicibacter psychrophenolicus TaxID=257454 RepID=A0ABS4WC92_9MICC|nr:hypothetical protein [Paeniglutamicibacter psychrophenolicus]MBP2373829.1 hypothetical protein [Paeniglutamicibacter psychrophenolicus]